jgi:hypothetical protein
VRPLQDAQTWLPFADGRPPRRWFEAAQHREECEARRQDDAQAQLPSSASCAIVDGPSIDPLSSRNVLFVRCGHCKGVAKSPYWHLCDEDDPVATRWPAAGLTVEKKTLKEFGDVDWCKCLLMR